MLLCQIRPIRRPGIASTRTLWTLFAGARPWNSLQNMVMPVASNHVRLAQPMPLRQCPVLPNERPIILPCPPNGAPFSNRWIPGDQYPAPHFFDDQGVPDFFSCVHFTKILPTRLRRLGFRQNRKRITETKEVDLRSARFCASNHWFWKSGNICD